MAYEVHTFGGGEYLYDIFQGVAALTSGDRYLTMIKISAMFAVAWVSFLAAFNLDIKEKIKWFITFMLLYNVMFIPKTTVLINDHLNPNQRIVEVSNVPFALGMFAGISSTIGVEITKEMEAAFTPVDYQPYHHYGMLFGSKLLSISNSMQIVDESFASSINSFIKQCVFYDLRLGKYSLDELKDSDNLWEFLTVENSQSPARSFEITEGNIKSIKTCRDGSALLKKRWIEQIEKGADRYGKLLADGSDKEKAKNLLLSNLPLAYSPILGVSKNATDLIKQNMMINAFDRAALEFSNTGTPGSNIYMQVRSNMQTRAAFSASKRQAEEWVPTLRIVFEVLFYGAFPLVFLMFLLPVGLQVAKGYFLTFVWLQSWAPLYAILNRIMVGQISTKASALGGYGLTLATHNGIEMINQNVALMAGYISWSIPFIAFAIAKGAGALSGLATSMLAIPQMAANSAAAEASTGNLSLGNSNIDNTSYNSSAGNKINDSAFFDSGRIQSINSTGGMTTINPDGRTVYDQMGSVSRLPNMSLGSSESESHTMNLNASVAQSMGENEARQASIAKAQSRDILASSMESHAINENQGVRFASHISAEVREAYGRLEQEALDLSKTMGIDKSTAFNMAINGNAYASISGGDKTGAGKISGGASIGGSADSRHFDSNAENERVHKHRQHSNDISVVSNAIKDRSIELTDSHGNILNESFNQSYNESERLEEQSRAHFEQAKSYSEQAQFIQSSGIQFTQDQIPEFIEFAKNSKDLNGNVLGEKALAVMANDPTTAQNIKDNFIMSKGLNKQKELFTEAKQGLGIGDLKANYKENAEQIDDLQQPNNKSVKRHFAQNIKRKLLNNNDLRDKVEKQINNNESQISNYKHDENNLSGEVTQKLQDGAFVTRAKAILNTANPKEKKTNFKNEEDS